MTWNYWKLTLRFMAPCGLNIDRSSHPEVFCKKGALRNFAKIHKNTLVSETRV